FTADLRVLRRASGVLLRRQGVSCGQGGPVSPRTPSGSTPPVESPPARAPPDESGAPAATPRDEQGAAGAAGGAPARRDPLPVRAGGVRAAARARRTRGPDAHAEEPAAQVLLRRARLRAVRGDHAPPRVLPHARRDLDPRARRGRDRGARAAARDRR